MKKKDLTLCQIMQLPPHASKVRGIYELNSPRRIYDEWMCLSQEISVPTNQPPQKYPKPEDMDQMFHMLSSKILQDIKNPSTTPADLTRQIFQTAQMVNSILNNYSNLVNLPVITSISEGPNGAALKRAVEDLETANANSIVLLNQYTSHCEILANSQIPMKKYWNILSEMNNLFFKFMRDYINKLKIMFQIVPYERVMQNTGERTSQPIQPQITYRNPLSTGFMQPSIQPQNPSVSRNVSQVDPVFQPLYSSTDQLARFAESFRQFGYTWRGTLIPPYYKDKCQSLANDVQKQAIIVDKMYEYYKSLPDNEKLKITSNYQPQQIFTTYEQMRTNLNILRMMTTKFTLEKVYSISTSYCKQLSLVVRELRVIVDTNRLSTPPMNQQTNQQMPQYPQQGYNQPQTPLYPTLHSNALSSPYDDSDDSGSDGANPYAHLDDT